MTRSRDVALRLLAAGAVLGVLVWRVGGQPFVEAMQRVTAPALAAAFALGAVATVSCAWRWRVVSRGLGLELSLGGAAAACYRSTFLNSTLPAGVAGDVHRAVIRGRVSGDMSRGVRSVAYERSAGQVVQVFVTVLVLLLLPSPVRSWMPTVVLVLVILGVALHYGTRARQSTTPVARFLRVTRDDVTAAVAHRAAWPAVVATSFVVLACHAGTFVIAARAAGVQAGVIELVPIALLVLAAMTLPLSLAGWGPREGAAAWAFGAAGLGATVGLTTAVIYGVLALAASLPGAVLLVVSRRRGEVLPASTVEVVHG